METLISVPNMKFCCALYSIDTVDQRCAAKGVATIERRPEVSINGIADVPFNSRKRLLVEDFPFVIGSIFVEIAVGVRVELPPMLRYKWMRQGKFGLE
jgi:hypothetical protein